MVNRIISASCMQISSRPNYAYNTLPIKSAEKLCVPQPGGQQAHGEETTDALEPAGCALAVADSHARAQWRLGGRLSQVVSEIPCVHAARFCLSLSDSPVFVSSDSVRRPWCASLTEPHLHFADRPAFGMCARNLMSTRFRTPGDHSVGNLDSILQARVTSY